MDLRLSIRERLCDIFSKWAHLGLLLNEDRSKLSKRQGDVAVEDFRASVLILSSVQRDYSIDSQRTLVCTG